MIVAHGAEGGGLVAELPASLLFGPVWRVVNPLRTLHLVAARLAGRDPAWGRWTLPGWLGCWPAAAGLLAFGSRWFERGDAFDVFSDLIGRLAPLGRRSDGRIVVRGPLNGLDAVRPAAGLMVLVTIGGLVLLAAG